MSGRDTDVRGATPVDGSRHARDAVAALARLLGERMYRTAALIFLFAILFRYFDAVVHVLLIGFVGAILGIAFSAVVNKLPVGRKVGTGIVALLTLGAIGAGVWFAISILAQQLRDFVGDVPAILEGLENWEAWLEDRTGIDMELIGPRLEAAAGDLVGGIEGGRVIAGAFGLVELIAMGVLVLVGAFFIVAKPNEQLLTPLLRTVPPERQPAFRRMFSRIGERLSGWLWGTLMSMAIIAAISSGVFWLLGVPHPILLGTLIGVLDIIPLIGPWIGGVVAVAVTLFYDPGLALWVAVAVIAIQEAEGNLVRPLVMSESAELHPFVTLLALLLFGSMFGLLGAILALPLILVIGTAVEVLWVEETLGNDGDEIEPLVDTS